MTTYLPFNLAGYDEADTVVDMSDLRFPCDAEKQVRNALIFLRNTSIHPTLDFSKCTTEMKHEYLVHYMTSNINVPVKELIDTWFHLMMTYHDYDTEVPTILTEDEERLFIVHYEHIVREMVHIAISIPLCSIEYYAQDTNTEITFDGIPTTDFHGINMDNYIHLVQYEEFIHLIDPMDDLEPQYYSAYFGRECNQYLSVMISSLPFLGMINLMLNGDTDAQDAFLAGVRNLGEKEETTHAE